MVRLTRYTGERDFHSQPALFVQTVTRSLWTRHCRMMHRLIYVAASLHCITHGRLRNVHARP
uniref:Uncharacterized protein n=1 Tax=Picea sitchensis TaxID=3332 RepID=A9NZA8_PICSI|nr:unknown [Picea sitchensis]